MLSPVVGRPVYSSCTVVCCQKNRSKRMGKLIKRDKLKELPRVLTLSSTTQVEQRQSYNDGE
jgi:hypothetical protein